MLAAEPPPPPPEPGTPAVVARAALPAGRSVRGRPLRALAAGDPAAGRVVLVVGQVHGDEPGGRRVVAALRRASVPAGARIVTVLSANPDGAAARTRVNARGWISTATSPGTGAPVRAGGTSPGRAPRASRRPAGCSGSCGPCAPT
ncbi:hypothetical protein GKE82_01025 [Conexibacter sp. W3-3-2]|nr:hypothetical protein [Conexibacter sp. W3-3-2]